MYFFDVGDNFGRKMEGFHFVSRGGNQPAKPGTHGLLVVIGLFKVGTSGLAFVDSQSNHGTFRKRRG